MTTDLIALGYIGLTASSGADWRDFATGKLGMMAVDKGGKQQAFRMYDRRQRLIVEEDGADGLGFIGWEAPDRAAMDRIAARLDVADVRVTAGNAALAAARRTLAGPASGRAASAFATELCFYRCRGCGPGAHSTCQWRAARCRHRSGGA